MSILQVGLLVEGEVDHIDGNLDPLALERILERTAPRGEGHVLGITSMPGPQTTRSIRELERLRAERPALKVVWGGYFPSMHTDTVLRSGLADIIVRGAGEETLRDLMAAWDRGGSIAGIPGTSHVSAGEPVHEPDRAPLHPDRLPRLPYHRLPMTEYLLRTHLGRRTVAYQSSVGCPFRCNFCGVVKMYRPRLLYESPHLTASTLEELRQAYGIDAVEFFDVNFFHHRGRVVELAGRIEKLGLTWWGEGRIDTLLGYSDDDFRLLRRSGLRMFFSGAESADDEVLAAMKKDLTADRALEFVARMKGLGIIPELSFILGNPPDPEADFARTTAYIRRIKEINPEAEIIIYVYTPVPQLDSSVLDGLEDFRFPETLAEWATPRWEQFGTNKSPATPWLPKNLSIRIKEFEAVLNARYPTRTDLSITPLMRRALKALGSWRYRVRFYRLPLEVVLLQKLSNYRRPETVGF